ncbi:TPA: hypothetical protein ACQQ5N_002846 [Pseudomonas aeruginosa]|uniref:hypothetical protein n=1 Tax=Pseudomonas aeruginosa TaxID=287 RepID=UPI001DF83F57|nr:hypothetical protein [Pseudomonas aeruginosa]
MTYFQIFFALAGFALMTWAMTVSKQYMLIGAAMFFWALVVASEFLFGTPAV